MATHLLDAMDGYKNKESQKEKVGIYVRKFVAVTDIELECVGVGFYCVELAQLKLCVRVLVREFISKDIYKSFASSTIFLFIYFGLYQHGF